MKETAMFDGVTTRSCGSWWDVPDLGLEVMGSCGKWPPVRMEVAVTRRLMSPLTLLLADAHRRTASTDCCFFSGWRDAV